MIIRRLYEARTSSNSSFKKEAEWLIKDKKYGNNFSNKCFFGNGEYVYTNTIMCLMSDYDLGIGEPVENEGFVKHIDSLKNECTREISVPKLIDLTQHIKTDVERQKQDWETRFHYNKDKFSKDRTFYDFGKNDSDEIDETLPMVDANYLKHMLNAMGNDVRCYTGDKSISPLYFISSNGEGILMPVKRNYK